MLSHRHNSLPVIRICIMLLVTVICTPSRLDSAPIREMRGAWIVTANGLDWPKNDFDANRQQLAISRMMDKLVLANFNTIFIELQHDGSVLWTSILQPGSIDITGNGEQPLPYDVTEHLIEEAHNHGLEVYGIVSPYYLGTKNRALLYDKNRTKHPIVSERNLLLETDDGEIMLDPGNPDTREYLNQLYTELIANYALDGIVLDKVHYPAGNIYDAETFSSHNVYGQNLQNWRSGNLDELIMDISDLISTFRPDMKLAVTAEAASNGLESERTSDIAPLLDAGFVDFIVPKIFTRGDAGFKPTLESWTGSGRSGSTVIAITPESALSGMHHPQKIEDQIDRTRDADENLAGLVVYRVSLITDTDIPQIRNTYTRLRNEQFIYPAHLPVFPTRVSEPPFSPLNVGVETDEDGNYIISWETPPEQPDGSSIKYYTVYIARDGKTDISEIKGELIHRTNDNYAVYTSPIAGLEFAVTAFDGNNVESAPAFSGKASTGDLDERPYVFSFQFDNLYIAGPKIIDKVDIYSSWGNHIKSVQSGDEEVMINCSDLGGGVYVVHTAYSDGANNVNKFIK